MEKNARLRGRTQQTGWSRLDGTRISGTPNPNARVTVGLIGQPEELEWPRSDAGHLRCSVAHRSYRWTLVAVRASNSSYGVTGCRREESLFALMTGCVWRTVLSIDQVSAEGETVQL